MIHKGSVDSAAILLREDSQHIHSQDVRRPLPDGSHLGISQQGGQAGVLDVALSSKAFDSFGNGRDTELAGEELQHRGDEAKDEGLRVGGLYSTIVFLLD